MFSSSHAWNPKLESGAEFMGLSSRWQKLDVLECDLLKEKKQKISGKICSVTWIKMFLEKDLVKQMLQYFNCHWSNN